jgi:hypothetical protein
VTKNSSKPQAALSRSRVAVSAAILNESLDLIDLAVLPVACQSFFNRREHNLQFIHLWTLWTQKSHTLTRRCGLQFAHTVMRFSP